jgi:hypothetical protein
MLAGIQGTGLGRLATVILGLAAFGHGQIMWQTTHTKNEGGGYNSGTCALTSASVKVRVHPAFLDVEEDAEIGVVGSVSIGNDPKSLEIVANFSLPPGSAITGALLWDGNTILQGKLLDRKAADSLYEEFVDRNSTPPARPRDPIILEKTGDGTYRFRIYPVTLGYSRHMRIRYQLPPVVGPEGVQMPIKAAVSSLFPDSRLQVPVTIENGGITPKIIFAMPGNIRTEMTLPRTRLMTTQELGDQGVGWDEWGNMQSNPGMAIQHVVPLRQAAIKSTFATGQMAGNYLNLFATVSPQVLKGLNLASATRLAVVVRNAGHSYDFAVPCDGGLAVGCGSLMFHGKSDQAWSDTLEWEAYDAAGKLLARTKVNSTVFENAQDTGAAVLWASAVKHFSEKKELPLGPVFGFVDDWASLLALPKDSISPSLADFYAMNGVPRISNASVKDVIPNYEAGQVPNGPTSGLAAKTGALPDPKTWKLERFQGGFVIRMPGLAAGLTATVELYDLSGKRAGYWTPRSDSGAINLASAAVRPGIYVLKVRVAGKMSTKRIVL